MVDQGPNKITVDVVAFRNHSEDNAKKKHLKPDVCGIVDDGLLCDKDHRRYDDNLQLFVGNIPQSTTEKELKGSFSLN